ncbi:MAG: hypothetical protein A2487_02540 [Candidatus Raymondbacteria bacterium RifOxyC12_full_50_8]|uniref:Uncharacterized protein n=1 Tax=Candidatus Raymondbacteria bacterium RIFOXYD12_FULL_49_13 TaxID=1817890 RepID=A0A1F7FHS3_UNCRA|nr:MAG: hypothetical protein A2248_21080 [Candidatus Raymondbacteria bacterium RIFOXYA2_FULL_49_16]OGJ95711.1 MAG: hypothetical protein A2350_12290 [Candidatus Raymondbacteria bacterium RifOxyB12_full_50_8]OGK06284.1 MAG: hypothetical protein A2519_08395 [Candidatus Raymondbacteria bacterium RIFOXYD12_FULL_49_13]OGK07738.1 MAG: hypothetical protein A2487_02540 [Candidatus Raymondbacteria bacterium RifOxyC12_full_50_8]OGP40616.1 MAG: hypothetical protein A2324_03150 [Candidatus Raymondbacteria b
MPGIRWVTAPNSGEGMLPGQLNGIFLQKGEKVRWSWTFGPDGSQVVTGYQIDSKKKASACKKWRMGFAPGKD